MFTGIITHLGTVVSLEEHPEADTATLTLDAGGALDGLPAGGSLAVGNSFTYSFDVQVGAPANGTATGGPATVARQIAAFVERTGADELMLTSSIWEHEARKRSFAIAADAMRELRVAA